MAGGVREKVMDVTALKHIVMPEGWGLMEYIEYAVEHSGYELILIWGEQGSGKSNLMLQLGFKVFGCWEKVFEHLIFTPSDLVEKAEKLPESYRYDCLLWDDVGVHFPSTKFKTDPKTYERVAEFMDAHRTIASVIICTAPNFQRYPKVLRDNCTLEIYTARDREKPSTVYAWVYRHNRALSLSSRDIYFFKREVCGSPLIVDLYSVPSEVWERYWALRLKLARESLTELKREVAGGGEAWIDIYEASKLSGIPVETLHYRYRRGLVRGMTINGLTHLSLKSLNQYLECIGKPPIPMADRRQ